MRVLLVGAGAVGIVLHRALEQQKGSEVTFLLSAGKPRLLRTKIVDSATNELRVRERPISIEAGTRLPIVDTVLFCVRADQLAKALDDVGPLAPGTRLATVTPGTDGLALLRERHPGHPAVRIAPAFMAYFDDDVVNLWHPPLVKTPVLSEGDTADLAFAEELAHALSAGGVPAQAREKMIAGVDAGGDALNVLLAGYALAKYDADVLAADRALLTLVGDAVGEAVTLGGAPGVLGFLARKTAGPLLRAGILSAVHMPARFSAMWRVHGPKLDSQTRGAVDALVERAQLLNRSVPALETIKSRLQVSA